MANKIQICRVFLDDGSFKSVRVINGETTVYNVIHNLAKKLDVIPFLHHLALQDVSIYIDGTEKSATLDQMSVVSDIINEWGTDSESKHMFVFKILTDKELGRDSQRVVSSIPAADSQDSVRKARAHSKVQIREDQSTQSESGRRRAMAFQRGAKDKGDDGDGEGRRSLTRRITGGKIGQLFAKIDRLRASSSSSNGTQRDKSKTDGVLEQNINITLTHQMHVLDENENENKNGIGGSSRSGGAAANLLSSASTPASMSAPALSGTDFLNAINLTQGFYAFTVDELKVELQKVESKCDSDIKLAVKHIRKEYDEKRKPIIEAMRIRKEKEKEKG